MSKVQKYSLFILVAIAIVYFIIFSFPNSVASNDINMVGVFEPDEVSPYQYAVDMISPHEGLKQTIFEFFNYEYYFYGFPYFAYSALVLLPLRVIGQLDNIPVAMYLLRQFVSLAPIIAGIGVLVYLQTGFKSKFRAAALFLILITIPAIVRNNYWWHPDGLVMIFVVLTIFFLYKDNYKFKKYFYLAAFTCGVSAAIKLVGFFFFLTIAVYLLMGLWKKAISLKQGVIAGTGFIAIMAATFMLSNPILIYAGGAREQYLKTLLWQSEVVKSGYEVQYATGTKAWSVMFDYYGAWFFLAAGLILNIWKVIKKKDNLLSILIITWAVPFGIYELFFTALKFQYLLPILIPLLSEFEVLIPAKLGFRKIEKKAVWQWAGFLFVGVYFGINFISMSSSISERYRRSENHPLINYFDPFKEEILTKIPDDFHLKTYVDPRIYFPKTETDGFFIRFKMLDYEYINNISPALIVIRQQRIWDYTHPDAVANYLDKEKGEASYAFYTDADIGNLDGFELVYRTDDVLVFMQSDAYEMYIK